MCFLPVIKASVLGCLVVLLGACGNGKDPVAPRDPSNDPAPAQRFLQIHPGAFMMGSPEDEPGRPPYAMSDRDSEVLHEVTLTRGFFVSNHEVTEGLWHRVMGGTPRDPQLPVRFVSWDLAVEFCNALSDLEGLSPAYTIHGPWGDVTWHRDADGYRLPTDAEWEYACRAGSAKAFSDGPITHVGCEPTDPVLDALGWYCGNSSQSGPEQVGRKQANAWGLYDMHGNVAEWVWDGLSFDYENLDAVDPVQEASVGASRTIRGGHWGTYAQFCRSAYRNGSLPAHKLYNVGLRPVRTAF